MERWIEKWKARKPKEKLAIAAAVAVAVAVAALAFGVFGRAENGKKTVAVFSADGYVEGLESRLSATLSSIRGAGKTTAAITVASGMRTVAATESEVSADGTRTEKPVLVNGKPLILREEYPEIAGVVIVSEGADNLGVRMELARAAAAFLGVDVKKVEVYARKS